MSATPEVDAIGRQLPPAHVRKARSAAGVAARTSIGRAVQRVIDEWDTLTDDDVNRLAIAVWPRVQAAAYASGLTDGARNAAAFLSARIDEVGK